jgi:hypothetical protein
VLREHERGTAGRAGPDEDGEELRRAQRVRTEFPESFARSLRAGQLAQAERKIRGHAPSLCPVHALCVIKSLQALQKLQSGYGLMGGACDGAGAAMGAAMGAVMGSGIGAGAALS